MFIDQENSENKHHFMVKVFTIKKVYRNLEIKHKIFMYGM